MRGQFLKYYWHQPYAADRPGIGGGDRRRDLCGAQFQWGCQASAGAVAGGCCAIQGTAVLDIISPCVTFNNAESSTKSYPYGKDHEIPLHEIQILTPDYVDAKEEITIDEYDAKAISSMWKCTMAASFA